MKNIFKIYVRDLKKIFTNTMAIILAVGVAALPSLYAWFNIYANWDPYGNTGNMKVAVIIEDEGYSIHDIDINVGEEIRQNLMSNKSIDWQFVSKKQATDGVRAGDYYAAIEIPSGFSKSLTSIVTTDFKQPVITYYANEKKNAIATKITDKVVQTVQQSVNESFVTTVINLVNKLLGTLVDEAKHDGGGLLDTLGSQIESAKNTAEAIKTTVNGFEDVLKIAQELNDALSDSNMSETLDNTNTMITDTQSAIKVTEEAVSTIVGSVDSVLTDVSSSLDKVSGDLIAVGNAAHDDIMLVVDKNIEKLSDYQGKLNLVLDVLNKVDSFLPIKINALTKTIGKLNKVNDALTSIITELNDYKNEKTKSSIAQIGEKVGSVSSSLTDTTNTYKNDVKPALETAIDDVIKVLMDASDIINSISGELPKINTVIGTLNTSIEAGGDMLSSINDILDSCIDELDGLSNKIKGLSESELANTIINITDQNAEELGQFIACPIIVETEKVYGIDNYGSAMAPFYSTLAIWVGGVILVAIFKTNVKNKKEIADKVTPNQAFFGRALTFITFAIIQSLIICLGDLYFLKIQCYDPFKYILAGVIGAIIFDFFIYSICVALGEIGKAVPVIMLVIQLGGCGGTFPVDVTPHFFQMLNPFMPFTYLIEAMRECICGAYQNMYWIWLGKLCIYLMAGLVAGTLIRFLLRKPIIFFSKQIEKTGLF